MKTCDFLKEMALEKSFRRDAAIKGQYLTLLEKLIGEPPSDI